MIQMQIRQASALDYPGIEKLVLDSFEPITWFRTLDAKYGPLNGLDWRARWTLRLQKAFTEQIVLVGELDSVLTAMSSSTVDPHAALGYIDILAVACNQQQHGYGREMLNATLRHLQGLGMQHVHLDCLTTNERANALYESEGFEEVARHIRWARRI